MVRKTTDFEIIVIPEDPFVSSTTLLESEACFSSLVPAPLVAQLQRICLLPSHFPDKIRTNDIWM